MGESGRRTSMLTLWYIAICLPYLILRNEHNRQTGFRNSSYETQRTTHTHTTTAFASRYPNGGMGVSGLPRQQIGAGTSWVGSQGRIRLTALNYCLSSPHNPSAQRAVVSRTGSSVWEVVESSGGGRLLLTVLVVWCERCERMRCRRMQGAGRARADTHR